MDSDVFFEEVIEIDYGSDTDVDATIDSDKENHDLGSTNKVRVKKEQFAIMSSAMTNEDSLDKDALKEIWERLTTELNVIGPPTFSMLQWRRKWTEHKYNKKRRSSNVDTDLRGNSNMDQPLLNQPLPPVEASVISSRINVSSEVLQNLNIVKQNQAVIKEKLDHSNSLLEQINKKISEA